MISDEAITDISIIIDVIVMNKNLNKREMRAGEEQRPRSDK